MNQPILSRELVARHLGVSPDVLVRYEASGLVQSESDDQQHAGYTPQQLRRVWTVLTLHRDLGVNLAGVELVLRLREHVDRLHGQLAALAQQLDHVLDETPIDDQSE